MSLVLIIVADNLELLLLRVEPGLEPRQKCTVLNNNEPWTVLELLSFVNSMLEEL